MAITNISSIVLLFMVLITNIVMLKGYYNRNDKENKYCYYFMYIMISLSIIYIVISNYVTIRLIVHILNRIFKDYANINSFYFLLILILANYIISDVINIVREGELDDNRYNILFVLTLLKIVTITIILTKMIYYKTCDYGVENNKKKIISELLNRCTPNNIDNIFNIIKRYC